MTRKKHEEVDNARKNETGEEAENMDINSQEPTNEAEQVIEVTGNQAPADENREGGQNVSGEEVSSVKESKKEDSPEYKLAEMQDRYLRLSAEFDNYRKRTLREKIEITKHAGENILISIVPVMDDFERALKSMESAPECIAMKDGINLIYNKFRDFLSQHGIKEIEAFHCDFNVDLHEAVTKIPVEDQNLKGKVVEVLQKGYYLHDKVMRFSKVVVGE